MRKGKDGSWGLLLVWDAAPTESIGKATRRSRQGSWGVATVGGRRL